MQLKIRVFLAPFVLISIWASSACAASLPAPTGTSAPTASLTAAPTATRTPKPSMTPLPTKTPDLKATEQVEKWNAETQKYFDLGYLPTAKGKVVKQEDFNQETAVLGWYYWWHYKDPVENFYLSAHLRWSSAYRSAAVSGCGFAFDIQPSEDNYAVILDRSKVLFINTDVSLGYYLPVGLTRGTGRVDFDNPFDHPVEADLTLIVKDAYAYVLVNGEVVGEYTLAQSRPARGRVGPAIMSGTNKGYGTRCAMNNIHLWIPEE